MCISMGCGSILGVRGRRKVPRKLYLFLAPGPKNSGDFAHPVAGRNSPQTTCGHGLQKSCSAKANERMSGELIKLINSKQPNGLFS